VREALTDKRTYTIYWIAGGIKICAVSNFINTGNFVGGGVVIWGVFYEKGSKGKKVLLQDM
jgi:hypothetical protein